MDKKDGKVFEQLVTLESAGDREGTPYTDGRDRYVGRSGYLCVREVGEEMYRARFYTTDDKGNHVMLSPSDGKYMEGDENVMVSTKHSCYVFAKRYEMERDEEDALTAYALRKEQEITEKLIAERKAEEKKQKKEKEEQER